MAAEATIDIAINVEPWRSPQPANDWRAPARTVKISRYEERLRWPNDEQSSPWAADTIRHSEDAHHAQRH